jgi:tetratricopeptide (TPR) repeat protein
MRWPSRRTRPASPPALAALLGVCAGWAPAAPIFAQELEPSPLAFGVDLADSSLADLRRARNALLDARDFDAALNPAQALVDAQENNRQPEYAADLATLGFILGELRRTDDALEHLIEAIDLVEAEEGPYTPALVEYYRSLGRAYIKGARYAEAIATLEQGQHISQRNLGLFNVEQSSLLDDLTTAYLGLGDTLEAHKVQLERLDNAVRRFGAADPRVVPFRYVLANYYERSRLPESARGQYEEVLKSQESRLGTNDPALLTPLREIAGIDLLISQGADTAHRDRLASLLEDSADASPAERGESLALLGDWATVTGDAPAAREYYRQAWSTLAAAPGIDVGSRFGKPLMLDFIAPLSPVDRAERRRPYVWGELVLEFDVSAEGLPSNVRVVNRDTRAAALAPRYLRRLRETHFRPRLVDGEPVPTAAVRATHYVRYYLNRDED